MDAKFKIGISACLLGDKVRYDGSNKPQRWIIDTLGPRAQFIKVCPEVAMGLSVPREAMRLVHSPEAESTKLITSRSRQDKTDLAITTSQRLVHQFPDDLDGLILMSKSPMCGDRHVKSYDSKSMIPTQNGSGFFAVEARKRFPLIPFIESGRLNDNNLKEGFLSHLAIFQQIKNMAPKAAELQKIHRINKFLLMSYNTALFRKMGRVVAETTKDNFEQSLLCYLELLRSCLQSPRKIGQVTDALLHLVGFLKNQLSSAQKTDILTSIERYQAGTFPITVPINLIRYAAIQYPNSYLQDQSILSPIAESWSMPRA